MPEHRHSTRRDYNFNYAVTWADQTGLVRVFDDGGETFFEFAAVLSDDAGVYDRDGQPLRFERHGVYLVVEGVHRSVLLRLRTTYSYVAAQSKPELRRSLSAEQGLSAPKRGATPEVAAARGRLANVERRLQDLASEVKAVEKGQRMQPMAELIQEAEAIDTEIDGVLATLVRVRFPSGVTTVAVDPATTSALVQAALRAKQIIVRGRTDSIGSRDLNERIARARAVNGKRLLIDNGVDEKKVALHYSANTDYVASNATPDGRARNRRVEFVFVGTVSERLIVNVGHSDLHASATAPTSAVR